MMIEKEEWRTIKEYPNYQVSNLGHVRKTDTHIRLKSQSRASYAITLCGNNHRYSVTIARLVLSSFVRPLKKHEYAININGRVDDNRLVNLRISRNRNLPPRQPNTNLEIDETFELPKNLSFIQNCSYYMSWLDKHVKNWRDVSVHDLVKAPQVASWYAYVHEKLDFSKE